MNYIMEMFETKLMKDVNDILKEMSKHRGSFGEVVNWADLKCVDVEYVSSLYSHKFIRVIIEEAAPENGKFTEYIHEMLISKGYKHIEVVTEW